MLCSRVRLRGSRGGNAISTHTTLFVVFPLSRGYQHRELEDPTFLFKDGVLTGYIWACIPLKPISRLCIQIHEWGTVHLLSQHLIVLDRQNENVDGTLCLCLVTGESRQNPLNK